MVEDVESIPFRDKVTRGCSLLLWRCILTIWSFQLLGKTFVPNITVSSVSFLVSVTRVVWTPSQRPLNRIHQNLSILATTAVLTLINTASSFNWLRCYCLGSVWSSALLRFWSGRLILEQLRRPWTLLQLTIYERRWWTYLQDKENLSFSPFVSLYERRPYYGLVCFGFAKRIYGSVT
jgi:hypothetical protein